MEDLIKTAKEIDRILDSGIEILPSSPIHEKLKKALNLFSISVAKRKVCFNTGCGYNEINDTCLISISKYERCGEKQTSR